MATAYLNGVFLPLEDACIPVMDRGFLFGDGVYEVVPVYGSRLFRLKQHLERLDQSLGGIRLRNPLSHGDWQGLLAELVERNGGGDQAVYLQVTRGATTKRDHAFPPGVPPTVFAMSQPLTPIPERQREQGATAITLEDIRWKWCHVKAVTLLPNVLLRQRAVDAGADEAILIRDGEVTEGAASNVCVVRGGVLATPPKGPFLLPGITRDLILELATAHGVPYEEVTISEAELREADEVWLTSSTKEILPVTRLDDRVMGAGRPGPLWTRMYRLYQDYKQAVRTGTEE